MEMVCFPSFIPRATWPNSHRLFFIEGALTILVAFVAVFVLPDFPSTSHRWLSPIEARLAEKRMEEDAGADNEDQAEVKSQRQILVSTLTDWKVMYMALRYISLRVSRTQLTCLLREASPLSLSPSHLTHSSPLSLPRLGITER